MPQLTNGSDVVERLRKTVVKSLDRDPRSSKQFLQFAACINQIETKAVHFTGEMQNFLSRPEMGFAFVISAVATVAWHLSFGETASTWTATHWLFTYEHGVIKRGLVGTLLAPLDVVSIKTVTTLSLWFAGSTTAMLAAGLYATLRYLPEKSAAMSVAAFILTSPATVQQWHYDLGRFDMFGFVLLCLSCAVVLKTSKRVGLVAVFAISATAILLHEAFFFWVAPMSLAVWIWAHGEIGAPIIVAVLLSVLTTWIGLSSYADRFAFDEARVLLQNRADLAINDNSLRVHYRSLIDNVVYASEHAWAAERWPPLALGAVYLGAMLLFLLPLVEREPRTVLVLLAGFSPLALLLLGHDQGRWSAMIACNLMLLLVLWLYGRPKLLKRSATFFMCLGITANLCLGPFGVTNLFPALAL